MSFALGQTQGQSLAKTCPGASGGLRMAVPPPWDVSGGVEHVFVACSLSRSRVAPFTYIACTPIPESVPYFAEGCACEGTGECLLDTCPCTQSYNADRCLVEFDAPAYECADACDCPISCNTRVVQTGLTRQLEVFDTGARGLGLRTLQPIAARAFVIEYAGRLVSATSASSIARTYEAIGCTYLLVLRENQQSRSTITFLDAGTEGNAARFINHSCEPNLVPVAVRIGRPIPRIAFFALQPVAAGTELTFSYGRGIGTRPCLCGKPACVKVLPFDGF